MKAIGAIRWAIAEGYIPGKSTGSGRELTSHETVCVLNMGDTDARVEIAVYFSDREPAGPFTFTVPARRTQHIRFNDFCDPEKIPVNTDFASVISAWTAPNNTAAAIAANMALRSPPATSPRPLAIPP
jgi:hypothetical protein